MLKIKGGVDLKELEKFGFQYEEEYYEDGKNYYWNGRIFIKENKQICQDDGINSFKDMPEHKFSDNELIIIYDLIQANLVEKVE